MAEMLLSNQRHRTRHLNFSLIPVSQLRCRDSQQASRRTAPAWDARRGRLGRCTACDDASASAVSGTSTFLISLFTHLPRLRSRTALVLYGSETGNAQDVAEETERLLERLHFTTVVLDLDSVQLRDLVKSTIVIFVVSTAGQGELPQNARAFWRTLLSLALKPGTLRKVRFCSFGLGDSSYPRYNVAHRMLHGRLLQLGAKPFCDRGEGNEQHPEGHSAGLREWHDTLKTSLIAAYPLPAERAILAEDTLVEPKWKLDLAVSEVVQQPNIATLSLDSDVPSRTPLALHDGYPARIYANLRLTPDDHFQDVRLLDLHVSRNFDYGPGAVAVVHPKNFPEDVNQFIDLMRWQEVADLPLQLVQAQPQIGLSSAAPSPLRHLDICKVTLTLRWLLENALDIMAIPRRSFFALLSHFAGTADDDQAYQKERLLELANPELIDELWDYTTRPKRTILEVMMDFTTVQIPWQYALSIIPIMRGRQFSIASGGALTKTATSETRVQLLIAIVDPPSPIIKWRRRYGVCTRYITSLRAGQEIFIGLQHGYLAVKPDDAKYPVIMIGPGTGLAPMRALIYHRLMLAKHSTPFSAALSRDTLYFGCRSTTNDYFFRAEWEEIVKHEGLTVRTAFSRDSVKPKQYVQDLIRIDAELVAHTLVDLSGKVYVCGSSGNMPKGVREALVHALASHPEIASIAEAAVFLDNMEKIGSYKQETW